MLFVDFFWIRRYDMERIISPAFGVMNVTKDRSFYKSFFILCGTLVLQNIIVLSVNLADNVMDAVYEHFHGRGCKESFLQYCREHDIAYREVWR